MQFICRLAVLFGRRPAEVAGWPAWELRLLEHYLAKQPAPIERVEVALAHLAAIYVNAHLKPGAKPAEIPDFLPYLKAFEVVKKSRYSDTDMSILKALGAA